jgi:hypothetical protein
MTTKPITFADFSRILKELGFISRKVDVDGPRIVFHHKATDTTVALPPLKPHDPVPIGNVIGARVVFPSRGVTTEEHLDELLDGATTSKA